jgi:hypothetical protein
MSAYQSLFRLLAEVDETRKAIQSWRAAYIERRGLWMELEAELAAKSRNNINEARALMAWADALVSTVCCGQPRRLAASE